MKRTLLLVLCVAMAAAAGCSFEDLSSGGGGPIRWESHRSADSNLWRGSGSGLGGSGYSLSNLNIHPNLNVCPNMKVCPK